MALQLAGLLVHRTGALGLVLGGEAPPPARPYPVAPAFVTAAAFLVDLTVGTLLLGIFAAATLLERRRPADARAADAAGAGAWARLGPAAGRPVAFRG